MTDILEGKTLRDKIIKELSEKRVSPKLAIIQVGNRPDSSAYINQKKKFGEKVGAVVEVFRFSEDTEQKYIEEKIGELNEDKSFHGIIVQLPVPKNINSFSLIENIDHRKDVDGLTSKNTKKLLLGDTSGLIPATAKGIMSLLSHYKIDPKGKKAVVIGRSQLVGYPIAQMLLAKDASVIICHSKTKNIPEIASQADILIVATGNPEFFGKEYVNNRQVVIDVGINLLEGKHLEEEVPDKKFVGDVKFDEVKDIVSAITPVPGGVGPMTVASLLQNLFFAYFSQQG